MKVPFVDLTVMHNEIRSDLDNAYKKVIDGSIFIHGDECKRFEEGFAAYTESKYCVGTATGLDAIYLILKALDIKAGDEVIIPSNTFIATALAVTYTGATPVFVEPTIDTFNIDVTKIEEKITSKTKVIIPVHLQGRAADLEEINKIAKKHNLYVVDDACQSHGSHYKGKKLGGLTDATAWSFYPGKNLGALGDGGCITTNNKEIAEKVKTLGNYGSDYKYHHIYKGTNSRLDEIQSAFLAVKLPHLDKWNNFRRAVAKRYINEITNPLIKLPKSIDDTYDHVYHVFVIRCDTRDELEKYLSDNGVQTLIHYPIPMHLQEAYKDLNIKKGELPIAEEISNTSLSIPMYYGMSDEQIDFVIKVLNDYKPQIWCYYSVCNI